MNETTYKIIAKDIKAGIGRNGDPYIIENLVINFNGKSAKVRTPKNMTINIGDEIKLALGTRRGWGRAEICAVVSEVFPAESQE